MAISVRLNWQDEDLFKQYATQNNMTLSDLIRESVFERIENEYDLKVYKQALDEYKKNPKSYSHDEIKKLLEID